MLGNSQMAQTIVESMAETVFRGISGAIQFSSTLWNSSDSVRGLKSEDLSRI